LQFACHLRYTKSKSRYWSVLALKAEILDLGNRNDKESRTETAIKEGTALKPMETNRLILRGPCTADAQSIMEIRNSEFVLRYNAMCPYSLERTAQQLERDRESMLVLERKEDGKVIGAVFVSADGLRYQVNACDLAYYLAEEESRKGYMSEALTALIDQLFADGAEVVSARSFRENTASRALLQKLGFAYEGCLRKAVRGYQEMVYDDCFYSITKEEYKGRKKDV